MRPRSFISQSESNNRDNCQSDCPIALGRSTKKRQSFEQGSPLRKTAAAIIRSMRIRICLGKETEFASANLLARYRERARGGRGGEERDRIHGRATRAPTRASSRSRDRRGDRVPVSASRRFDAAREEAVGKPTSSRLAVKIDSRAELACRSRSLQMNVSRGTLMFAPRLIARFFALSYASVDRKVDLLERVHIVV